jgi:TPR repeat protein
LVQHLALCYERGAGVPPDPAAAASFYFRAAVLGCAEAKVADYKHRGHCKNCRQYT